MEPDIVAIKSSTFNVMTYLVICPDTWDAAVIDPGEEPDSLLNLLVEKGVRLVYVLNTHGHADHVQGNAFFKKHFKIPVLLHEADNRFFTTPKQKDEAGKMGLVPLEFADILLKDGDILHVGHLEIRIIHTPGHTPGSVCFFTGKHLFTGDTLFVGDAGRTDGDGGSLEKLLNSIEFKLMTLPHETIIWPGHDYGPVKTSTIGNEIKTNPYINDFILS